MEIDELISPSDLEFVEIHNMSDAIVTLSDLRLRGGIDADFDPAHSLEPNASAIIVSFDPTRPDNASRLAAFRRHYNLDEAHSSSGISRGD